MHKNRQEEQQSDQPATWPDGSSTTWDDGSPRSWGNGFTHALGCPHGYVIGSPVMEHVKGRRRRGPRSHIKHNEPGAPELGVGRAHGPVPRFIPDELRRK